MLLAHVLLAFSSVAASGWWLFYPSVWIKWVTYSLMVAVLGSGLLLVLLTPTMMTKACVSGLIYFSAMVFVIRQTKAAQKA
jgi:hypothetical protein